MLRYLDLANTLTIGSLLSAFASVILAINGVTGLAFVALIVSGICDLLDGLVARRLPRDERSRRFGGALDSIVDGCAFGFAPSILLYCAGLNRWYELPLLAALPVCVVWRVAYYEVVGLQMDAGAPGRRYYTGLPATYVALVLPLVAAAGLFAVGWFRVAASVAVALLCATMVSRLSIRKPGGLAYLGFVLLAVAVTAVLVRYGSMLPSFRAN